MGDNLAGHAYFPLEDDLAASVAAIQADATSGPITLARRGVDVVVQLTAGYQYERPLQINLEIQGLARALLEARPDCMPLANLASEMARPLPEFYGRGRDEGTRMRADLRARAEEWLARLEARAALLAEQVAALLPERGAVATLGRESTTMLAAAHRAGAAGKRIRVLLWPVEGAPADHFADHLAGAGVRVGWLARPSPAEHLARARPSLVVVSAHAVDRQVVVAPGGTGALVLAAGRAEVPCFALAGPEKLVPANYALPPTRADGRLERLPLSDWTGILAGDAVLSGEAVESVLASVRLESTLL